jgi:hypothetical protein
MRTIVNVLDLGCVDGGGWRGTGVGGVLRQTRVNQRKNGRRKETYTLQERTLVRAGYLIAFRVEIEVGSMLTRIAISVNR